jgi:hypothetical protein
LDRLILTALAADQVVAIDGKASRWRWKKGRQPKLADAIMDFFG